MFTEFFLKNAFNLAILFSCGMALLVVRFWLSRNVQWKKGFTFHAAQFFIYAIIIGTIGSILNNAIEDYNLRFISSGVIDFICTSLIALILTIKLFLIINQFEKAQVNKGRDVTSTRILARVIKITIIVAIVLLYGEHFGMSLSGLLTFGGIGGIAVGMAGKDVL
ncbi:mechanosensitive ion channel, partial [Salmonella enterica]